MLVITSLFKYLPHHIDVMHHRAVYYLWGQEGDTMQLWQWFELGKRAGGGVRDLFKGL
jgi:hypothetical protein